MTEGDFAKKKELFLEQKKTLDTFLKTGAISRLQYDKSYGDLVKKMGDRAGRSPHLDPPHRGQAGCPVVHDDRVRLPG